MKTNILTLILSFLLVFCFGQKNKDLQLGLNVKYSSFHQINPPPFGKQFFLATSPGLSLSYQGHRLTFNYEFAAFPNRNNDPLKYGPFSGLQKDNPKGISASYQKDVFQKDIFSVFVGIDAGSVRYFISEDRKIFHFSQSNEAQNGFRAYFLIVGFQTGAKINWRNMTTAISLGLNRGNVRINDLAGEPKEVIWLNMFSINAGVTYWIVK